MGSTEGRPAHAIRLLHTSDLHLDANHTVRDGYWPERRRLMEQAFAQVIDLALAEDAQALVLAGDTFDHRRPGRDVVESFVAELHRFGRPVLLLPGNHDAYEEGSVYRTVDWSEAGRQIHLVQAVEGQEIPLPELGVVFWGRAYTDAAYGFRPLGGIPQPSKSGYWHVAVGHGHFVEDDEYSHRSQLIRAGEIAGSGWDYVALGHWEHAQDVSRGGTVAYYSGTPMPLVQGRGRAFRSGTAALVTLAAGEVRVNLREIGEAP